MIGKLRIKVFSHDDADAKSLLTQVSKYTSLADSMKLPFWIFANDSNPLGIVTVGEEPIQLLAPVGTSVAVIDLIQKNQRLSVLREFAFQSLRLALEKKVRLATIELASEEQDAVDSFLEAGFEVLADNFTMTLQLDRKFGSLEGLGFEIARKEEISKWIGLARAQ